MRKIPYYIYPIAGLLTLTPWIGSAFALLLGIVLAIFFENPYKAHTSKITKTLLKICVIGLGAGMNLNIIAKVGLEGVSYTVIGILSTLLLGTLLGRFLKIKKDTSLLIAVGTAICGGSAIAAVAPVLKSKDEEVSIALGTIFILNAVALFLFPYLGSLLELSQTQFGLWSALAIHDTSSVVGATMAYGEEALKYGTTIKLARALWIIPLAFAIGIFKRNESTEKQKVKYPWFILGFLLMASAMTIFPNLKPIGDIVDSFSQKFMVLTLFLIGTSLNKEALKTVGFAPLILGIFLWFIIGSGTLFIIHQQLIY